MNKMHRKITIILISIIIVLSACNSTNENEVDKGYIRLYGETHAIEGIINKELELWQGYYENGYRHLFIEFSYFHAQFLNLWMQSENNDILDALFDDLNGTFAGNDNTRSFFLKIKESCPETIFHGTDIGHTYNTTGARYLKYLEDNNLTDTEKYTRTMEAINQGKYYYENNKDPVYRENTMTQNFILEFETLNGTSVMGIYGSAHTNPQGMDYYTQSVPCMANQLSSTYGEVVICKNIIDMLPDKEDNNPPIRTDKIEIDGKEFEASYFGKQDLSALFPDYQFREFWRLEKAYEELRSCPVIQNPNYDYLPFSDYPMSVEIGQVFLVKYTLTNGTTYQTVYRSDGAMYDGELATWAILVE